VNARLVSLMQEIYRLVYETSASRHLDMRSTALQLGIERIAAAKRTRGIFP
jgi:glutamate dehydrogenase/leucine dehydrogenase